MDPIEVGKKVKEFYPQYANTPDNVVGQRFIQKYGDKGIQSLGLQSTVDTKEAAALRKEFSTETKNLGFKELENAWNKVKEAPETGAGDLTIIYSYIKALDPTTAVREGEINLTKAAESIPSNIIRAYKRAKEGKVISPELRQEMAGEISRMYNEKARGQKELNAFYSGLATDSGVDPKDVIGTVGEVELAPEPSAGAPQQKQGLGGLPGMALGGADALTKFLFPSTRKLVSGQGLREFQNIGSDVDLSKTKGNLGESAKAALGTFPEVLKQVGPAALELGIYKGLGGAKGGIKGILSKGKSAVSGLTKSGVSATRTAAAEKAGEINAKKLIETGNKYIVNDPRAKETWDIFRKTIGEKIPVNQLLDKMKVWKEAYTAAGRVGRDAESGLFNSLYQSGKATLKKQAPEVAKQTEKLRFLYEAPKKAQQATWLALKSSVIGKALGLY